MREEDLPPPQQPPTEPLELAPAILPLIPAFQFSSPAAAFPRERVRHNTLWDGGRDQVE